MDVVLRTLLFSYPSFKIVKDELCRLVEHKAVISFQNCNKTLEQMNNIIKINCQIQKVCDLEYIVEKLISNLSTKERLLIEYKFFRKCHGANFDYSSRAYFRDQDKAFNHLLALMKQFKYDSEWLLTNYGDLYFITSRYNSLKKIKALGTVSNSRRDAEIA